MTNAERLPLRAGAGAITLLSGAVMVLAGYIGRTDCWRTAGFIAIPGGVLILAAFALARRAERADGHPVADTGSDRSRRAGAIAATLSSGAVMVFAGYAGSAWGWGLAGPLTTVGGLVIGTAFTIDRGRNGPRKR